MTIKEKLKTEKIRILLFIILSFVISRFIMYVIYCIKTGDKGILSCIQHFNAWDAGWYLKYIDGIQNGTLAVDAATGQAVWAFFPLYPLTVFVVWKLLGGTVVIDLVGVALSTIFFLTAEYYAYKYMKLTRGCVKTAYLYIAFLTFGLYSFYFSIMYTESLFLMLLTMCFYHMKKENYILMGICGALMSATRNVGVMFVFVVLIYRVMQYQKQQKKGTVIDFIRCNLSDADLVFGTFLIPAGLFSYMGFLMLRLGDGMAFVHVQKAWGRKNVGVLHNLYEAVGKQFPPSYLGVALAISILLILYTLIRNRRFDEMVLPILIVILGASSQLQSIPRYMIGCFTVVLAFTDEYKKLNRIAKIFIAVVLFGFELILIKEWVNYNSLLC